MIRNALTVLLALALAGCGFHLRDSLALPEDTPPVQVVSTTPFSELATILERNLRNAGAPVVTREQVQANPGMAVARLDIVSERWGDLPIAIDDQGFVTAITMEATEEDIQGIVYPHPTMSEAMHEAALDAYGRVLHL